MSPTIDWCCDLPQMDVLFLLHTSDRLVATNASCLLPDQHACCITTISTRPSENCRFSDVSLSLCYHGRTSRRLPNRHYRNGTTTTTTTAATANTWEKERFYSSPRRADEDEEGKNTLKLQKPSSSCHERQMIRTISMCFRLWFGTIGHCRCSRASLSHLSACVQPNSKGWETRYLIDLKKCMGCFQTDGYSELTNQMKAINRDKSDTE